MISLTHDKLCEIAEKWLNKHCGVVFRELRTEANEHPDAIGFRSTFSILIECKVSRSDFKKDQTKLFRQIPSQGMGSYRYYMCPEGLLLPEEIPNKWGLLYVNEQGKVRKKIGPKGNIWSANREWFFQKNHNAEIKMMYSALRRLNIRKVLPLIYEGIPGPE